MVNSLGSGWLGITKAFDENTDATRVTSPDQEKAPESPLGATIWARLLRRSVEANGPQRAKARMVRNVLVLLMALALLGCGKPPSKEAFARVKVGMSQAQVEQTLGRPAQVSTSPDDKALVNWTYSDSAWVNFNNGEVSAVVFDRQDMTMAAPPEPASSPTPGPATPAPSKSP